MKTISKMVLVYFMISVVFGNYTYIYGEEKLNIAVMNFQGQNISAMDAMIISGFVRNRMVASKQFKIIDKVNMDKILTEQGFQQTGCTTQECAVQMGNLLNVQKIINGTVSKLMGVFYLTVNCVDVEAGEIQYSRNLKFREEEDIKQKTDEIVDGLIVDMTDGKPIVVKTTDTETIGSSEMVLIPAGGFTMGSSSGSKDEKPPHEVYLDAYCIDKYEVTNAQYAKFLNEYGKDIDDNGKKMINRSKWGVKKKNGRWQPTKGYENHPVVCVSWYGANQYAKYYDKRLPTEAEWEKACRAGSTTKYCYGDNKSELDDYAWYNKNSGSRTHPVGQKKPNRWGIYDMHGNVWEWCSDRYGKKYYSNSLKKNPWGPESGKGRILRGCSGGDDENHCRATIRYMCGPIIWNYGIGFRCADEVRP